MTSAVASTLSFLGATGTVTGSRFLLDTPGSRVLVDCGMYQGLKHLRERNWAPFPVDPRSIDAVVLTHAHLDHSGYLPALVRDGFTGPILATAQTAALAAIVMVDSGHLQEEDAAYANAKGFSKHHPARPLYTEEDAHRAATRFHHVPFATSTAATADVTVTLRPAGHILGSSTAELRIGGGVDRTLFASGDLGRSNHPILRPPAPPPEADVMLVESTYGNRVHTPVEEAEERLAAVISRTAARGGTVVIPSFAVDRTEVILLALRRMVASGRIPQLPVYADSPMALAVLHVYRKAMASGDPEIRPESVTGGDPFDPGSLHELRTPEQSRQLNDVDFPSIIISASGMATGGRVLHHLARCLPDRRCAVVLPGFQAEGTRGRLLADGATTVKMLGRYVPVRAEVVVVDAFSAHADGDEIVDWLRRAPRAPDTSFVVHGEPRAASVLAERLANDLGWHAVVPVPGERVRVD
ncbi:MAG TPA: MBL fold metallo-hydrolase [Acidimicrobiales bacterium]|nr:MBL fold metallo-hydrolase [Acidimicrobiales bacterium]